MATKKVPTTVKEVNAVVEELAAAVDKLSNTMDTDAKATDDGKKQFYSLQVLPPNAGGSSGSYVKHVACANDGCTYFMELRLVNAEVSPYTDPARPTQVSSFSPFVYVCPVCGAVILNYSADSPSSAVSPKIWDDFVKELTAYFEAAGKSVCSAKTKRAKPPRGMRLATYVPDR